MVLAPYQETPEMLDRGIDKYYRLSVNAYLFGILPIEDKKETVKVYDDTLIKVHDTNRGELIYFDKDMNFKFSQKHPSVDATDKLIKNVSSLSGENLDGFIISENDTLYSIVSKSCFSYAADKKLFKIMENVF